ncbi:MAG: hypothetical protein CSA97_04530 [Bacteroidetes bacterium]|nr:MAG: hypothetical protein CSA97_04530 [Bacteroidota bacterium]
MDLEQRLQKPALWLARTWERHRVGILLTVVANLLAIILMLLINIHGQARFVESEVIFAIEEPEVAQEEETVKEVTRDRSWERETQQQQVRNIAVDQQDKALNAGLGDEKKIDAEELYREAARVRAEMEANRERFMEKDAIGETTVPNTEKKAVSAPAASSYQGPSVVSYSLKGRKAYELPVPAYRCKRGGIVVVDIAVNREGKVVATSIDTPNSEQDPCLHSEAKRAAKRSLFSPVSQGPLRQHGSITYMFVAQ